MPEPTTSKLDLKEIKDAIESFPNAGKWKIFTCSELRPRGSSNRKWEKTEISELWEVGGNYAFLLPAKYFKRSRTIDVDGPSILNVPRKILFKFCPNPIELNGRQWAVLYVGKTSNLSQRFQWHFSGAKKNTGGQVQHNLKKCGVCNSREEAVRLMEQEALICYRILDKDEEFANREMIEVNLWAKYNPPFNIKSER
ncbi:MAG: GIY-YIG nuclease family protein [Candidatus Methylacidiphilales bacterium]|nr:GIY-YIG nuclease family protein [Candidatus Methylacidiphilales bacterium]